MLVWLESPSYGFSFYFWRLAVGWGLLARLLYRAVSKAPGSNVMSEVSYGAFSLCLGCFSSPLSSFHVFSETTSSIQRQGHKQIISRVLSMDHTQLDHGTSRPVRRFLAATSPISSPNLDSPVYSPLAGPVVGAETVTSSSTIAAAVLVSVFLTLAVVLTFLCIYHKRIRKHLVGEKPLLYPSPVKSASGQKPWGYGSDKNSATDYVSGDVSSFNPLYNNSNSVRYTPSERRVSFMSHHMQEDGKDEKLSSVVVEPHISSPQTKSLPPSVPSVNAAAEWAGCEEVEVNVDQYQHNASTCDSDDIDEPRSAPMCEDDEVTLLGGRNRLKSDEEQPSALASANLLRSSTLPVCTNKGCYSEDYPEDSEQADSEDKMCRLKSASAMPSPCALKENAPPHPGAALPHKEATKQDGLNNYFRGAQTKSHFVMAPTPPPALPLPLKPPSSNLEEEPEKPKVLKPRTSGKILHNNRYTKFEETVDLYPVGCQPSAFLVKKAEKLDAPLRSSYISAPSPAPRPLPAPATIQALPIVPAEAPDVIFPNLQDYMHQFAGSSLGVDSSREGWSSPDSPSSPRAQLGVRIQPHAQIIQPPKLGTFNRTNLVSHPSRRGSHRIDETAHSGHTKVGGASTDQTGSYPSSGPVLHQSPPTHVVGNDDHRQGGFAKTNPFGPSLNPFGEVGDRSLQSSFGDQLGFMSTNSSIATLRSSSGLGLPTLSSSPPRPDAPTNSLHTNDAPHHNSCTNSSAIAPHPSTSSPLSAYNPGGPSPGERSASSPPPPPGPRGP